MNTQPEATLEISYPKALLISSIGMAFFVTGLFAIGLPMRDPLLIGFLAVMVVGMPFVFAGCLCFMLRCKIGRDGLRPAVPTFYQQVLRWEEITVVGFGGPFYGVWCGAFSRPCLLPRPFLLKRPESLKEFIRLYAPPENILRQKLECQ